MIESNTTSAVHPYHIWIFAPCDNKESATPTSHELNLLNFNQVLSTFKLEVTLELEELIPQSDSVSLVSLPIKTVEDFHPLRIAANIAPLKPLLDCHQTIKRRLEEKISDAQCKELISQYQSHPLIGGSVNNVLNANNETVVATPQSSNKENQDIDRLFGLLDLGDQVDESSPQDNQSDESLSPAYKGILSTSLHEIQRPLFQHINKVLQSDNLQALEQTWRGLKFLVDKLPENGNIVLTLFNTSKNSLALNYTNAIASADESRLPALVVFDFEVNCTSHDLTMLSDIAISCEDYQAPSIINLSNSFMGKTNAQALLGTGNDLARMFSQPQYIKWKSLREKTEARWVTSCFNRFLLRAPYNRHNNPELAFSEWVAGDDVLLMGHPSWMVAALVMQSINSYQWPTELSPPHGVVENIALHSFDLSAEQRFEIPLETLVDDELSEKIAEAGVCTLLCQPDRDQVFVRKLPTLIKPTQYDNSVLNYRQQLMAGLPYQLLSTYLVNIFLANIQQFISATSNSEMNNRIEQFFLSLIESSGDECSVNAEVVADNHNPGHYIAKIKIKMGNRIMNGVEVELGLPL